jgi:hypothetical protein
VLQETRQLREHPVFKKVPTEDEKKIRASSILECTFSPLYGQKLHKKRKKCVFANNLLIC